LAPEADRASPNVARGVEVPEMGTLGALNGRVEGVTKTLKGGLQKPSCILNQRMLSTGGLQCAVATLVWQLFALQH